MTNPEIRPRLIDGEPVCSGEECPAWNDDHCEHEEKPPRYPYACAEGLRRLLAEAREALRLAEGALAGECNDGCESEEDRAKGCVFDGPEPCAFGVALRALRAAIYAPAPSGADGVEGEGKP